MSEEKKPFWFDVFQPDSSYCYIPQSKKDPLSWSDVENRVRADYGPEFRVDTCLDSYLDKENDYRYNYYGRISADNGGKSCVLLIRETLDLGEFGGAFFLDWPLAPEWAIKFMALIPMISFPYDMLVDISHRGRPLVEYTLKDTFFDGCTIYYLYSTFYDSFVVGVNTSQHPYVASLYVPYSNT